MLSRKTEALLRERPCANGFARRRKHHDTDRGQSRFAESCWRIVGFQGMHFNGGYNPANFAHWIGAGPWVSGYSVYYAISFYDARTQRESARSAWWGPKMEIAADLLQAGAH
jgi:hypothetical protein